MSRTVKPIGTESTLVDIRGCGVAWGEAGVTANGYGVISGVMKDVLRWIVVMVTDL